MATKFKKLNSRFGIIEYPVTLEEMEEISLEFPKTERKFYEFAIKALRKVMLKGESILFFTGADPKLTKNGFLVIGDNQLYLVALKGGLMGGAEAEVLKYTDIKKVDFDIAPNPLGLAQMELGMIYLETKGLIGNKKRTVRNIPENSVDEIASIIRALIR